MTLCKVCTKSEHRYKCPKCFLPFCSLACSKQHKQDGCQTQHDEKHELKSPVRNAKKKSSSRKRHKFGPSPDEIEPLSEEQLLQLSNDEEIQKIMQNKKLVERLRQIDSASDRVKVLEAHMKDPSFIEICNTVLDATECNPDDDKEDSDV